MADKFLSLPTSKQSVLRFDLERLTTDTGERAVVVTTEREQISLFCERADGSWMSWVRFHNHLDVTPRVPSNSPDLGWSNRVGIASAPGRVVLAYKRQFTVDQGGPVTTPPGQLWFDVVTLDEASEELSATPDPIELLQPLLGIDRVGFTVWADRLEDRLLVVAQALDADNTDPRLLLMTVPFPSSDGDELRSPLNWDVRRLDQGGWDFDARRAGDRLTVVHRRTPAAYATDLFIAIDPAFRLPPPVILTDDAETTPRPLREMATGGMVLIEAALPSGEVTRVDETLPFGEVPQIHSTDPLIVTVDRLQSVSVGLGLGEGVDRLTLHFPRWAKFLVMGVPNGWGAAPLLHHALPWPLALDGFEATHQLVSAVPDPFAPGRLRLELAALFSLDPVVLFALEPADKGTVLTFGHRDPFFAALRATAFRVFADDGGQTLIAEADGYSVLDIGHHRIKSRRGGTVPAEHERFEPFELDGLGIHEHRYTLRRREFGTTNTLAWGLAAPAERPFTFYAYADMGDGGGRVVHDERLPAPTTTALPDTKAFDITMVPEPVESGRAWIRLRTPDLVDTELAGYLVLPTQPGPRSLASDMQRLLDVLPVAAVSIIAQPVAAQQSILPGGGEVVFRDAANIANPAFVESVTLTRETADAIEELAIDVGPPLVVSSEDQPFALELIVSPAVGFASQPILLRARAPALPGDAVTFEWEFPGGATATGAVVEQTFAATEPDFSTPNPLAEPADPIRVTLRATAADGAVSVATAEFPLAASLWATLWNGYGPFRKRPDDEFEPGEVLETAVSPGHFARDATLDFLKYRVRYRTAADGIGQILTIVFGERHSGRFHFVESGVPGQGDVEYEMPITVSLAEVGLTGTLGSILGSLVAIEGVDATLLYTVRFQPCVQTSERREGGPETETVVIAAGEPPRMAPSALCCVPDGDSRLDLAELTVRSGLTTGARNMTILVLALVAGGLTAVVMAALLPLLIIVTPVAALPTILSAGISVITATLAGAGLAALGTWLLEGLVVRPLVEDAIRSGLTDPSTRAAFDEAGLARHAGEGLAEALAVRVIRQAQADGHAVADPDLSGRDRFRPQFFETIVVGPGEGKAKIRIPA